MKNVYIAGKFSHRGFYRTIAQKLIKHQFAVTSQWIWEDEEDFLDLKEGQREKLASRDIEDIERASILIIDTRDPLSAGGGGGREFELGYAAGRARALWRVGPSRNVFHSRIVTKFDNWQDLIDYVARKVL